jgi:hypothetical protein
MTLLGLIESQLRQPPPDKQREVLDFVEFYLTAQGKKTWKGNSGRITAEIDP